MSTVSLPLLPLKNVTVFPALIQALIVGRAASLAAIKAAVEGDGRSSPCCREPEDEHPEAGRACTDIGTVSTVTRVEQRDGGAQVIVRGVARARLHRMSVPQAEDQPALVEVKKLTELCVLAPGRNAPRRLP